MTKPLACAVSIGELAPAAKLQRQGMVVLQSGDAAARWRRAGAQLSSPHGPAAGVNVEGLYVL